MNSTRIKNFTVYYNNKKELHTLKNEIFRENIYDLGLKPNLVKNILDIGSHIGLSVLYFKSQYPKSNIIAFEPNPINFSLLERNIFENNLNDVYCIKKGVYPTNVKKTLYYDKENTSTSSFFEHAWDGSEFNQEKIVVENFSLSEFINQKIDILKMDVEGLETEILLNLKNVLPLISNIVFEYHYMRKKTFNRLESFLMSFGFSVEKIGKLELGKLCIIKCRKI